MITRVRVKNFRSLADVDVTLGPLTVLVGRNGAGKSAFIDALRFVRDAVLRGLDQAVASRRGMQSIRRASAEASSESIEFTITGRFADTWVEYGFAVNADPSGKPILRHEICRMGRDEPHIVMFEVENGAWKVRPIDFQEFAKSEPESGKRMDAPLYPNRLSINWLLWLLPDDHPFDALLTEFHAYAIYADALRKPQQDYHNEILSEDNSNLASVLLGIEDMYPRIASLMGMVVEDITGVQVVEREGSLSIQMKHHDLDGNEHWFDLHQESDGTVRFLTMLVALFQPLTQSFICIEEPEISLYPRALALLSGVIKEASLSHQVVITTQSPDLISAFHADDIRVAERKNSKTEIGSLLAEQINAVNADLFTTGDLLRIEGLRTTPFEAVSADNA